MVLTTQTLPTMTHSIKSLISRASDLHRQLNSQDCPPDINEQHKKLFDDRAQIMERTTSALSPEGYLVHMHDAFIEGFSERRSAGGWRTKFHADAIADAIAYAKDDDDQTQFTEKGYCRVSFDIQTRRPLRALSGREIHTFLIDGATQELGACFHEPGRNMGEVVARYDNLSIEKGPIRTWDQLHAHRLAAVPSLPATLRVEQASGTTEHAARWHTDGTIVVKQGDEWQAYSDFTASNFAQDETMRVFIDAGDGACSQVGADLDEHGPSYANVQPLKTLIRRQQSEILQPAGSRSPKV